MSAPSTHDFKLWVVLLNNLPLLDVESIKVEFPPGWTKHVGGQGKVTRAKSNNQTAKVTITVPETSLANTLLDQLYEADNNTPGGVTYPFLLKDALGTTLVNSLNTWLEKKADIEESAEPGMREWVLDCGDTQSVIAGK